LSERATVVLFDIDGTLIDAGGAGRRAMEAGFEAVTRGVDGLRSIRFDGMTDRSIVREGLRAVGQTHDTATVQQVIDAYLERLPCELQEGPPRILPGVVATLDAVAELGSVAVGLGTGNVETGARTKLRAAALDDRFAFGGFGSDHELRAELLRVGVKRGAARLGRPVEDCQVLVVGDTPRDVAAARAIGASCLAVASSHYDAEALQDADPALVVADLLDPAALAWLRAWIEGPREWDPGHLG